MAPFSISTDWHFNLEQNSWQPLQLGTIPIAPNGPHKSDNQGDKK
jgi:hypothetical protein